MSRRNLWLAAAVVFTVINFGGAVYAAATGELMHTAGHVALLLGGYLVWQLVPRGRRPDQTLVQATNDPLDHIQQSVDAIAVEVERIGEAQRFHEKIIAERKESSPSDKQQ
jgi:hypothetical protein